MAIETKKSSGKKPDKRGVIIAGLMLFFLIGYLHSNFQNKDGPAEAANQTLEQNTAISESEVPKDIRSDVEVPKNDSVINQTPPSGSESIGTLSIISNPSGAAVFIDNTARGSTPLIYNLSAGNHFLDMKKPGYQTYRAQVLINAGATAYLNATMIQTISSNTTQNSSVQTGTLSIYSNPAKATILIDNQTLGANTQTPAVYSNISEGYHAISFEKTGYVPYSVQVYVASGILTLVEANLTALDAQFGTLNITTSPEQADFYLDNKLIGTTPIVYNATVDYHFVRLEKDGYISYNKRFYMTANKVIDINVNLQVPN